jgi:energy-converting hydrogenase Eha subunit F
LDGLERSSTVPAVQLYTGEAEHVSPYKNGWTPLKSPADTARCTPQASKFIYY